jgi:hypothetical protein
MYPAFRNVSKWIVWLVKKRPLGLTACAGSASATALVFVMESFCFNLPDWLSTRARFDTGLVNRVLLRQPPLLSQSRNESAGGLDPTRQSPSHHWPSSSLLFRCWNRSCRWSQKIAICHVDAPSIRQFVIGKVLPSSANRRKREAGSQRLPCMLWKASARAYTFATPAVSA